ncbi:hypothetical protein [Streptomyces sp. B21-083]|uniref:hypothetical protein n=1 Tax=Streptomyces sp. B21-083 TaxID=3039410 RepID=UPI002FF1E26A
MKFKKLVAASAGVGVALAGTVLAVATPAMAATNCTTWISSNQGTGFAKCTGGDTRFDDHRVKVVCIDSRGIQATRFGPWVNTRSGKTSKAVCSDDPGNSGVAVFKISVETDRL